MSGTAWVDVLDVGQGLAVLVRSAGHNLLYDTGPRYGARANAAQRVVLPYLRAMGSNNWMRWWFRIAIGSFRWHGVHP